MLNTEKVLSDANDNEGNVETGANFLGTPRNENIAYSLNLQRTGAVFLIVGFCLFHES